MCTAIPYGLYVYSQLLVFTNMVMSNIIVKWIATWRVWVGGQLLLLAW